MSRSYTPAWPKPTLLKNCFGSVYKVRILRHPAPTAIRSISLNAVFRSYSSDTPNNGRKEKWPDSYHRFSRDFSDHLAFVHPFLLPPSAWSQSTIISTNSDDLYCCFFLNIVPCRAGKIRAKLQKVSLGMRRSLLLLPKNLWLWQLAFDNPADNNLTWVTPPDTRKSEITLWLLIKSVQSGGRNFRQIIRKAGNHLGQFLRDKVGCCCIYCWTD